MKRILLASFLLIANICFSQKKDTLKLSLDENITCLYSKSDGAQKNFDAGIAGENGFEYRRFRVSTATNYSISFGSSITSSELIEKTSLDRDNFFILHVFNHSIIRKIKNDNTFGIGYGIKKSFRKLDCSISYAMLYQVTNYYDMPSNDIYRNSFRLKLKMNGDAMGLSTEYYYQPSLNSFKDYITYVNSKIVLLPNNKLNFIIQDVINYRSKNQIRMIHNLTFGIGYTFKK
jgi:hypothetical protein